MAQSLVNGAPQPLHPTGTVTFLFSDVEGSTQRWERNRTAMQAALRRHDELMRGSMKIHNGFVFKTVGDAFCAVFQTVSSAIDAAIDAQRALLSEDWSAVDGLSVRMAIHTGETDERDGDYFGPAVNRVARLLAIGHGGQVLVSASTRELAARILPADASLRDLGEQRLRDLTTPEHVYQLAAPGLPETFPTLRSLDALPNNLPLQLTSFVGRDEDVAQLKEELGKTRLLTLVGAGGIGKTRCALQVGADLLDAYHDGVWTCELATISDSSLVANLIGGMLDVQESGQRPLLDSIILYLKSRRALIILDNCEHVVQEVARIADAILRSCPNVSILATSREQLGIDGETAHRLPSLAVPGAPDSECAERAIHYGAIALFAQRAAAADSKFRLSDDNVSTVSDICRRLDGIALAIELAAVRVKVLNVNQLADRLQERFRILTGGSRTALPRQQTMRALIDWSYDLLSKPEQSLFRRVAVFAGGWTLEAAGAVCSDDAIAEWEVLDLLSALVDKSLVVVEPGEREQRYRLLESTREYALEKLKQDGEEDALARRHAEYLLVFAQRTDESWSTTPSRIWDAAVFAEQDNIRAALVWSLEEGKDVELGQRLIGQLQRYWRLARAEGRRWVRAALQMTGPQTPDVVLARLWMTSAFNEAAMQQNRAAYDAAAKALELYQRLGDRRQAMQAQVQLGRSLMLLNRVDEANPLLEEALVAARADGEKRLIAVIVENLATGRSAEGKADEARALSAEARMIARTTGDEWAAVRVASNLAEAEYRLGDAEAALEAAKEGLRLSRSLKGVNPVAVTLINMAAYLISLGRYDEARAPAREGLLRSRDLQADVHVTLALQHFAAISAGTGGFERAARLLGFVDSRLTQLDAVREYTEQFEYDRTRSLLAANLETASLAQLMNEGRGWDESQAVAEALLV